MILQVFHNLISNAIRHTPKGGSINISINDYGDFIEISVKDSGCGIENSAQCNIFDKFQTVKGNNSSTGLGLYIVKKILEAHNTAIECISDPGKGTQFTFKLNKSNVMT